MVKEIYEAMKARISIAPEEAVKVYYEDYPETPKDVTVYRFDLTGIDEDCPGIIHAMHTKNLWNVAQRFYSFLYIFDDVDAILLRGRHVSCK